MFDDYEKAEIVVDWNNVTGKKFAEVIFRKRWFEHEGVQDDGKGNEVITGINTEHLHISARCRC